ncbi:kinase-like protein [Lichtheimia hyalospora FSU 10163]|nr:kinase-like protein [Lichtheimia hyalospora FSU 10163]
MNEVDIQQLYNEQIQDDLIRRTREAVSNLIELCPHEFGLENLIPCDASFRSTVPERLAQLYQEVCEYCTEASIPFDHAWHWALVWRQQLSYKTLAERYGRERVVSTSHPRSRKAVAQIYLDGLDQYMQWFPWSWFSSMQFIGAGGFSAVYASVISPPYDLEPTRIALKIVDDKVLNEIAVQSKAFLPLLFQGLTVCESTGDLMMVMKLSNDGNLEDHMKLLPLGDLDLKTITGTILRLAANLADLHKVGMCHRNVHPRNIVCTDSDYFLLDYRFSTPSKESTPVTTYTKAVYGRLPYIAPEVRSGTYTEKSDIFSLGVIIWQLVSKVIFPSPDVLLDGDHGEDNVYRITVVPGIPEWYEKLYVACLEPHPENRPDASEICQALQPIHESLEYSVPLGPKVTEYIVARRAEVADHLRTYAKVKGIVSASTTRLYTLSNLPVVSHFFDLPFTNLRFSAIWPPPTLTTSPAANATTTTTTTTVAAVPTPPPASPSLSEFIATDIATTTTPTPTTIDNSTNNNNSATTPASTNGVNLL